MSDCRNHLLKQVYRHTQLIRLITSTFNLEMETKHGANSISSTRETSYRSNIINDIEGCQ